MGRSSTQLPPHCVHSSSPVPRRCAVVGAGFAGVAVAWHLLYKASREGRKEFHVDLFDSHGIAAGASGVAAGLLHPYTPRGKVLWRGIEAFEDALDLVEASETARSPDESPFVWRNGLLRLAHSSSAAQKLVSNAKNNPEAMYSTQSRVLTLQNHLHDLVPGLSPSMPRHTMQGLYIGKGLVLDPSRYLEALWRCCCVLSEKNGYTTAFHQHTVGSLSTLEVDCGGYDAIIVATGAALESIPEAAGVAKLDLCQGYSLELGSTEFMYPLGAPSLLGSPYVAFHGRCKAIVGATQKFGTSVQEAINWLGPTSNILVEQAATVPEVSDAVAELLGGILPIWPKLRDWELIRIKSGVRALPCRTQQGSIPYAGKLSKKSEHSSWWFISGLGARGLVYHAWLGRLVASAVMDDDESRLPKELVRWKCKHLGT
jgi:glycine/D-amino acid oxidase-like deaminating enzyme